MLDVMGKLKMQNSKLKNYKSKVKNMKKLIKKTRELNVLFEDRSKKLSKEERFMDLVEEVGELAQAMLIVDRRKLTSDPKKQKTSEDIADALCVVLFDLILLADDYELDLEQEYRQTLKRMRERLEEGEFDREDGDE